MKNFNRSYKVIIALSLAILGVSCKKGDIIEGAAYGVVNVSVPLMSTADNVAPILVEVKGKTVDTIKAARPISNLVLVAGDAQFTLRNSATGKVLLEKELALKAGETVDISADFFYAGGDAYTDDFTAKPQQDSILVRFIALDPLLPEIINIDFGVYYSQGGLKMALLAQKRLNGINKKDFSKFIQLPNPASIAPVGATGLRYVIEGYDAATGNKVMSFNAVANQATMGWIMTNPAGTTAAQQTLWTNNLVLTMGIGPRAGSTSAIRVPRVIFYHTAN